MIQDLGRVADAVNYALVVDTYIMDIMRASFIVTKARLDYLTMHRRIVYWIDGIYKLGENKLSHWLVNPHDLRGYIRDVQNHHGKDLTYYYACRTAVS